jgi:hypothetical protein
VMMDFGWPGFAIAHEPEVKLPTSVQAIWAFSPEPEGVHIWLLND